MTRSPLLLAACLLAAAGCSSGYSSGVDGSKPYSALDASEATTACRSLDEYLQDTIGGEEQLRVNCYVEALGSTVDEAACQAAFDSCMITGPDSRTFDVQRLDCSAPPVDPTCNADVSEVEACVTGQVDLVQVRFAALDCAIAGNISELQALQEPLGAASACAALDSTCPSLADGPF